MTKFLQSWEFGSDISPDGTTTFIIPSSEMGQGVKYLLSGDFEEEMDADWSMIKTKLRQ